MDDLVHLSSTCHTFSLSLAFSPTLLGRVDRKRPGSRPDDRICFRSLVRCGFSLVVVMIVRGCEGKGGQVPGGQAFLGNGKNDSGQNHVKIIIPIARSLDAAAACLHREIRNIDHASDQRSRCLFLFLSRLPCSCYRKLDQAPVSHSLSAPGKSST